MDSHARRTAVNPAAACCQRLIGMVTVLNQELEKLIRNEGLSEHRDHLMAAMAEMKAKARVAHDVKKLLLDIPLARAKA